jgi:hypothetical protein
LTPYSPIWGVAVRQHERQPIAMKSQPFSAD